MKKNLGTIKMIVLLRKRRIIMDKNTVVIAIDHGWSNMKTVHETFTSGIREITTEPALFENVLEKDGKYYIVTDRWQRFTEQMITEDLLEQLAGYCDEFLVHAVDVEGKASGIEEELVRLLGSWGKIPVTYAGGVGDFEDLARLKKLGKNMLNVTIGSALDLFGGTMSYEKVKEFCRE